jgi:hypothetical protein
VWAVIVPSVMGCHALFPFSQADDASAPRAERWDGARPDAWRDQRAEARRDGRADARPEDAGLNTISSPFGPFSVQSGWWIGRPSSQGTTVFFLIEAKLTCPSVSQAGWDNNFPGQLLEIQVEGTNPGAYAVPGQASGDYGRGDKIATGGTVTVTDLDAEVGIAGSFTLTFGAGTMQGTFGLNYCDGGVEP